MKYISTFVKNSQVICQKLQCFVMVDDRCVSWYSEVVEQLSCMSMLRVWLLECFFANVSLFDDCSCWESICHTRRDVHVDMSKCRSYFSNTQQLSQCFLSHHLFNCLCVCQSLESCSVLSTTVSYNCFLQLFLIVIIVHYVVFCCSLSVSCPLSSDRQHLSYDGFLEIRGEIIRTVLCCIVYWKLCTVFLQFSGLGFVSLRPFHYA